MQLVMTLEGTSGGPVTLADYTAGDLVNDWTLDSQRMAQLAEALRALNAKAFDRGNARRTLSFTNKRPPFDTPLDAAQFTVEHPLAIDATTGTVDITFQLGPTQQYKLHDAVITRNRPSLDGTTVTTAYEIVGGLLEKL